MRKRANKLMIVCIVLVVVGVLFACYFSRSGFYKTHFLPNTYVGQTDVSGWSYQDLKAYYARLSEERSLVLQSGELADTLSLSDIDFSVHVSDQMKTVIAEQSPWFWFTCYFDKRQYDLHFDVEYDEEKLYSMLESSDLVTGDKLVASVDARLDIGENGYEIVHEVRGTVPDVTKLMSHVSNSLRSVDILLKQKDIVIDMSQDYIEPSVFADSKELLQQLEDIKSMGGFTVTMNLVDAKEVLTAEQVNQFVRQKEDGLFDFDEQLVAEYVDGLAKKYTTLHSTREFKTSKGDTIKLKSDKDSYGFIFNKPATCKALLEALKKGQDAKVDVVWWEGYGIPKQRNSSQGDIGDTYVEVSIDEQHMWYYQDGKLMLDTDVTTGTDVESRRTPTGVYFIWKRESPSRLSGSYGSSNVTYWMAFSWDGCGIHDALWRSQFGGDIWKTNGSHGCVNTPIDKCRELYNMIEYDTPVVVYERK